MPQLDIARVGDPEVVGTLTRMPVELSFSYLYPIMAACVIRPGADQLRAVPADKHLPRKV